MDFASLKSFITHKQKEELPVFLTYHNIHHILDVYDAAERIAANEAVVDEDKTLLLTAVLFHDSGYMIALKNHEELSCNLARQYLPEYGYSPDQIERICGMIMATRLPQMPHNLLEEIIADADLDYLGRNDFFEIGKKLFHELLYLGLVKDEEEWNQRQIEFLKMHHYFTASSKDWRQNIKSKHIRDLQQKEKSSKQY